MRKINGKLFLALLVGLAVTGVGLFFLHRVQRGRIAAALLFQAKKADDEGKSDAAGNFRQRYLEFEKSDTDEMATLARQWAGDGLTAPLKNRQRAAALLDKVLTTVDDRELRKLLVKTALGLRDFLLARDHLVKLLSDEKVTEAIAAMRDLRAKKIAQLPVPENPEERGLLESYWGQLLEIEKKPLDAMDCYRLAVRHAPNELLPYVRLAYLLRRRTELDTATRTANINEADGSIDGLIEMNGSSADAFLTRWRYRRDFDLLEVRETANKGKVKLEAAAEDVAQALKRKPDHIDALLCAADLERIRARQASEDPSKSEEQRKAGLKAHRAKAFDHLRRGLDVVAKNKSGLPAEESGEFQLLWHKGNLLLDDLDPKEPEKIAERRPDMEGVIEAVRKTRITGAADYLLGRLTLIERNWAEAALLFERARTLLANQPDLACQADLFLGQCYGRLEEHTQMYNAFKRVCDWDPSSVAARIGMAEARAAQGQLGEARAQFDVLLASQQIPARALIDMARLEIQRQMVADRPEWRDAERLLQQAEEYNPRAIVEIPLMRAEMLMRQGKEDAARRELSSACQRCPNEVDLRAALADCAARRKKPAEAKKVLDDAEEQMGDKVGLRLARARLIEAGGKLPAEAVEHLAKRAQTFSDNDQARLLGGLADACLRANEAATARKLYARLGELPAYRGDLKLQLLLFDLALREQDQKGMEQTLETIKAIEQASGTYHRYGTALLTIYRARRTNNSAERAALLASAKSELDLVQKARPSWASLFLARAEVALLEDHPEAAIKNLQEATKNGESSPGAIRKLVTLLTQKGRTDEAQALINRVNKSIASGKELSRIAAQVAIRSGNLSRALDIARASIRDDSRDPSELVYVARVLSANRKYDEAEQKLKLALEIAPGDAEANLARVQFLIERKRKDEALTAIEAAEKNVPPAKRPLVLAQCYDVAGRPADALAQYALAAEKGKDDAAALRAVATAHLNAGRMKDAEPVLRRLMGGLKSAAAEDLTWARRSLATALAGSTDYARFAEALDLVGLKLDVNGRVAEADERNQPSEAVRARARVLASQAQKGFRDVAIRLFEALDRRGDLTPDDRFVLAMLYEADGKTERSQKSLRELTQSPLRTPRYLAQYAMSVLATRRDPDALSDVERIVKQLGDLEKLREVGPNGFASVELQARLLEAQKKDADARALIKKHVTREGARPEEVLLFIGTLSRQKRFAEAYRQCEKEWEKGQCPAEPLGAVTASLLRVMGPSDAQIEAVEKRLLEATSGEKASTVLRMQLADLMDRRGKYGESSAQWRKVLEAEPTNFVAMNNLAWQIVTQGGDATEALTFIDKALGGMGRRADLLDTRGLVYLAMKDTGKALADFQAATADGPTPTRLLHLARAQLLAKDKDAAKATLLKAKEAGLEVAKLHPTEQEPAKQLFEACGL